MRKLTRKELARYNGKNNFPAYIAYNGKVYDVSESFLWKEGQHQVLHNAGCDLTKELDQAPHGDDILRNFPQIGILDDNE